MAVCRNGLDTATAYRVGLCIVCGVARHSAGRPRCNACHLSAVGSAEDERPAEAIFIASCDAFGQCRTPDCGEPVAFGRVLCAECLKNYSCRSAGCDTPTKLGRVLCDPCLEMKAKRHDA